MMRYLRFRSKDDWLTSVLRHADQRSENWAYLAIVWDRCEISDPWECALAGSVAMGSSVWLFHAPAGRVVEGDDVKDREVRDRAARWSQSLAVSLAGAGFSVVNAVEVMEVRNG